MTLSLASETTEAEHGLLIVMWDGFGNPGCVLSELVWVKMATLAAGHGWLHGDSGHLQKENTPSPQHMNASSPGRKAFQGLHVNVDV